MVSWLETEYNLSITKIQSTHWSIGMWPANDSQNEWIEQLPIDQTWASIRDGSHWLCHHCSLLVLLSSGFCSSFSCLQNGLLACFFLHSFLFSFMLNKSFVYLFISCLSQFFGQDRKSLGPLDTTPIATRSVWPRLLDCTYFLPFLFLFSYLFIKLICFLRMGLCCLFPLILPGIQLYWIHSFLCHHYFFHWWVVI